MMLKKTTKQCSHCGEIKPVSEYYAKTSAKDGLQPWCKTCQNEVNKNRATKRKLQKRNTQLKRFSHYHLKHGLEYSLKGKRTKHQDRQLVQYKCLGCGKDVESTLDLAWDYRFLCSKCNSMSTAKPLFLTRKQEKENLKNTRLYNKLNNEFTNACSCGESHSCNHSEITPEEHMVAQELVKTTTEEPSIKMLKGGDNNSEIKVVFITVPKYIERPSKPKKGLLSKIKNFLFS